MDAMIHAPAEAPVEVTSRSRFETFRIAKPQKAFAAAFAVFATALAGCASGLGANTYDPSQVGRVARVEEGTIVAARPVTIEGSQQNAKVGTLAGAVGGAILGGVSGNAIGKAAGSQPGFAYTIRLPSGELVSVAQAGDFAMPAGTPVLIEYGARARVVPLQTAYGY